MDMHGHTKSRPEYYSSSMGQPGQTKVIQQHKYKEELWEVTKEAYYNIPEDYIKCQKSLPTRVQDVQREVTLNTDFCL